MARQTVLNSIAGKNDYQFGLYIRVAPRRPHSPLPGREGVGVGAAEALGGSLNDRVEHILGIEHLSGFRLKLRYDPEE